MGAIGIMVFATFIIWLLTKTDCLGNALGCGVWILICAVLAALLGGNL